MGRACRKPSVRRRQSWADLWCSIGEIRDYHYLSHSEIGCGGRISQHLSGSGSICERDALTFQAATVICEYLRLSFMEVYICLLVPVLMSFRAVLICFSCLAIPSPR